MTSDVADARPLSPGSGEEQHLENTVCRAGRERVSHQTLSLPDWWLLIGGSGARGARVLGDLGELGPVARVRRLAHPLSSCYAARNFSIEKTVPRESM
jgi:hypothetical protein